MTETGGITSEISYIEFASEDVRERELQESNGKANLRKRSEFLCLIISSHCGFVVIIRNIMYKCKI